MGDNQESPEEQFTRVNQQANKAWRRQAPGMAAFLAGVSMLAIAARLGWNNWQSLIATFAGYFAVAITWAAARDVNRTFIKPAMRASDVILTGIAERAKQGEAHAATVSLWGPVCRWLATANGETIASGWALTRRSAERKAVKAAEKGLDG